MLDALPPTTLESVAELPPSGAQATSKGLL
jgi:hypothetical protein